ncbi:MAG: DoxX family protein [Marmoricola sp.]
MSVVLWIVNVVLASAFALAGFLKVTRPLPALAALGMGWVEETSEQMVRAIGAIEIVGAVGLILPMATGILPGLTPLAAIGLATTMLGALVVHLKRAEAVTIPMALGALSVVSAAIGLALV